MLRVLFVNLEQTQERPRRVRLHSPKHVLIDGHRERGIGVPQPLAHYLHRHAGFQQQCCVGMAKIVKANLRESCFRDETFERLAEVVSVAMRKSPLVASSRSPLVAMRKSPLVAG